MLQLDTSYSFCSLSMKWEIDRLEFLRVPNELHNITALVTISDLNDKRFLQLSTRLSAGSILQIYNLPNGIYIIRIFISESSSSFVYENYIPTIGIAFKSVNGKKDFLVGNVMKENVRLLSSLTSDKKTLLRCLKPSAYCQSDNSKIKSLANKITHNSVNATQSALAIHDWVANNIYYDEQGIKDGEWNSGVTISLSDFNPITWITNKPAHGSALEALETRKSVCMGYNNLGIALLRAAGIPALALDCFALGVDTSGGWNHKENHSTVPNHCILAARAQNRWLLMDITWDSDNKYINGHFQKPKRGIKHIFFDVTEQMLSYTHHLLSIDKIS